MKLCVFIFFSIISSFANASEDLAAQALKNGEFEHARTLGRASKTQQGYITACRSGMLIGGYTEIGNAAVQSLHAAISDCHKAVALNPQALDARITLAIGVGFEGRRLQKPALAKQARKMLEQIYDDFPQEPTARAAIGGWHSEVHAAGFLARLYLGASQKKARQYFSEADRMGEADLPFTLEYLKLFARGGKADRLQGLRLAEKHLAMSPANAIDRIMLDKMRMIVTALETNDKKSIKKAIAAATAFNGIEAWRDLAPLDLSFLGL